MTLDSVEFSVLFYYQTCCLSSSVAESAQHRIHSVGLLGVLGCLQCGAACDVGLFAV